MQTTYFPHDSLAQLQLFYGEEKEVMDGDYYEEEYASSPASSVNFCYSEEEEEEDYYCSGDDIDEDDRDEGEVGMTNSTATENNEEFESLSDVALKYDLKLISDSESEDQDSSKPIPDSEWEDSAYTCRAEDSNKPAFQEDTLKHSVELIPDLKREDVDCLKLSLEGGVLTFPRDSWPSLEDWVDSWKVKNYQRFAGIHVYAYHSKGKGFGGYGVILRDLDAKPVTASAMFSAEGKSFFTQVLLGVKAGVTLAVKHGLSELKVECNSFIVPNLVDQLLYCRNVKCRFGDDSCICENCLVGFFGTKGSDPSLVPLVREIKARLPKGQHLEGMLGCSKGVNNEAAHYLAKMGKKIALALENKEEKGIALGDEGTGEIQPEEFPLELRKILWEDVYGWRYTNSMGVVLAWMVT